MWEKGKHKKSIAGSSGSRYRAAQGLFMVFLLCVALGGCGNKQKEHTEAAGAGTQEDSEASAQNREEKPLRIGLILTSRDDPENEEVQAVFQKLAEDTGAELLVKTPEVSAADAGEARELAYHTFVLCDVDPIEYQMLAVNELVEENVDVIAIHANHTEALESVLSAARGVGIRVVAFEQPVTEGCADVYAETAEGAAGMIPGITGQ